MSLKSLQVAPSQTAGGEVRPGHTSIHVQEKKSFFGREKVFQEKISNIKRKNLFQMIFFSICESEQNIFQEFFFHV